VIFDTNCVAKGNPSAAGAGGVLRGDKTEWLGGFFRESGELFFTKSENLSCTA